VRSKHRSDALFVLSGVAVRIAHKMRLHRDGSFLGLSPFETEMRRRLWWHVVHLDFRISDLLGVKLSLDLFIGDTKMPLNVEDEDLNPDMVDFPPERTGLTSVVICLVRCEIGEFLRRFSPLSPNGIDWDNLSSPDVTLAKKDSMINQLQDMLESNFVRYCDPSNTLHIFLSIMVRCAICKITLFAHDPRRHAKSPSKIPQSERDIIFTNATKLLEYVNLIRSSPGLEKYMWQIGTSFLWNALLFVLAETRYPKVGPEMNKLWKLIGVVLSKYPLMFERKGGPVFAALGKWTLKAWDDHVEASKSEGLGEPLEPDYISAIRLARAPATESTSNQNHPMTLAPATGNEENALLNFDTFTTYDFSDLAAFEFNSNELVQWDGLFVGEVSGRTDLM
jgi:hypothetical protein